MRNIAVLGAGTMGARIAAHFANAGCDVLLLDVSTELANTGLRNAVAAKPPAFFEPSVAARVGTGSFDDDLPRLAACDWIVEAVAEDLAIKRRLIGRIAEHRRPGSIFSTNTSGLPVSQIVADLADGELRRHWLGVHFFNPPRYMRLVEVIPTGETAPDVVETVRRFASEQLGKSVVRAKDTPNFIGNRVGLFALFNSARLMRSFGLTIEHIDALTGPLIGWPNTGTFRLMDLIGLDVLLNMQRNFESRMTDERSDVTAPVFLERLVNRGWLGDKTGGGFYKKGQPLLALDWRTVEYRPTETPNLSAIDSVAKLRTPGERVRALCVPGTFGWRMLSELWNYAARRVPEIADDIVAIDTAMRAGFNWQLGPFEMWDAAGVGETAALMESEGIALAPAVLALLNAGRTHWYSYGKYFGLRSVAYLPLPSQDGLGTLAHSKLKNSAVKTSSAVSLLDLGDGVGCIELHSKMNAIGEETMAFIPDVLAAASFSAYLIATDAANFSAGANLAEILGLIEAKDWKALAAFIKRFQEMTQAVKFSARPVVAAVCGLCLGGGAELAMHSSLRQAHAELSMGLVESSVGLIPGGGGCKELALLAAEENCWVEVFDTLVSGARSGSAAQAASMHLLRAGDRTTMNRDRLLLNAKSAAVQLAHSYRTIATRVNLRAATTEARNAIHANIEERRRAGNFSAHDETVASWLARIILAEHVSPGRAVREQDYLDAEREAFVALCAEPKTMERIVYTLKTGKPLRN